MIVYGLGTVVYFEILYNILIRTSILSTLLSNMSFPCDDFGGSEVSTVGVRSRGPNSRSEFRSVQCGKPTFLLILI